MKFAFALVSIFSLIVTIAPNAAASRARSKPKYLMVSAGDSITAGFLAGTDALRDSSDRSRKTQAPLTENERIPIRMLLAKLGESKRRYSWATGSRIVSHFEKLRDRLRTLQPRARLAYANLALSGAETDDLKLQSRRLRRLWDSGKYDQIPYATLLIGANDVCNLNGDGTIASQQIRQSVIDFIKNLADIPQSEKMKVLVAAMPRIPDLTQDSIFQHHLFPRTFPRLTCEKMALEIHQFCNPVLADRSPAGINRSWQRVNEVQNTIQVAVADAQRMFSNLDIHFSNALQEQQIELSNLALDCFHPNENGQQIISDRLWNDQPWF